MDLREEFLNRGLGLKEMFLLLFLLLSLSINGNVVEGRGSISLSKEEDLEIERLLKIINKPAVKTIEDGYGQTFSCVDINKQPAFDHPLLKNHKIQMGPGSLPKVIKDKKASSLGMSLKIGLKNGGCPPGTVPIRRIKKEDLIRAKFSPNFGKGYPSNPQGPDSAKFHLTNKNVFIAQFAFQSTYKNRRKPFGSRAVLNVWQPKIIGHQNSASLVILLDGSPPEEIRSIHAGWIVNKGVYGNYLPHLSTAWTNDGHRETGCYDVFCPGFVQVSRDLPVGIPFSPTSVYNGTQYYIILTVYKDFVKGDWWLFYDEDRKQVGYWPRALFNSTFSDHADILQWGGIVYNAGIKPWPAMGSGHMPSDDQQYMKACYIGGMQMLLYRGGAIRIETDTPRRLIQTSPSCYPVKTDGSVPDENYAILLGGPEQGISPFCPSISSPSFIDIPWGDGDEHLYQYSCGLISAYKFLVDDIWHHDEQLPFVTDEYGKVNNIIYVRESELVPPILLTGVSAPGMDVDNGAFQHVGLAVVPLWDDYRGQFSGMLTASDFISILTKFYLVHRRLLNNDFNHKIAGKIET
ncbi:protein neprosin-like [Tasmannia lanceolata]|uniref:protein neprosin-like n=1 Tax=Tasmannia lanceolata TaxID=3420 RepID=UPI004064B185